MKIVTKSLSLLLMFVVIGASSCKDPKSFDPSNLTSADASALIEVEEDLKNGEPIENNSDEKGLENYCVQLEQKMKSLDKESEELAFAWKLYKHKCHKCGSKDIEKEEKSPSKYDDKEKKESSDYCGGLKLKLKKLKADSKEYEEVQKLIDVKCAAKTKTK